MKNILKNIKIKFKNIKKKICILMAVLIIVTAPVTSYIEADAVMALPVLGSIAIGDILTSLLVAAGVTAAGYVGVTAIQDAQQKKEMEARVAEKIKSDSTLSAAIQDAEDYAEKNNFTVVDGGLNYQSPKGFKWKGNKNGDSTIILQPELVAAAAYAAKEWLDSEANKVEGPASGKLDLSNTLLPTSFFTFDYSYFNASDIDAVTYRGVYDALIDLGVSEKSALICYDLSSNSNVKIVYEVSPDFNTVILGGRVYYASNSTISDFDYRLKNYAVSAANNWFVSSHDYHNVYKVDLNGVSISSDSSVAGFSRFVHCYALGYPKIFDSGHYIYEYSYATKKVYDYKTVLKYINYDPLLSPSIGDGWSYTIPQSDYEGFTYSDISSLLDYINSLSAELENWREQSEQNQQEIIEQNKNILEGINKINTLTNTISSNIAKIYTSVHNIEVQIKKLPQQIGDEVAQALELGGISIDLDPLTEAVEALPDAVALSVAEALDGYEPIPQPVIDAITALPQTLPEAIKELNINPVINVPEIEIPEIKIPEITVPTPQVDVELNPNYDITVENDFTGVEPIISSALASAFVPDPDLTMQRLGDMRSYFKFVDDVEIIIAEFQDRVFNIVPSPYLRIPIGKTRSKKYDYGLGDYFVLDVSWYAEYKDFGDKIILAFVWAAFVWKIFVILPGIISGSSGFIFSAGDAYNELEYNKLMKKLDE